MGQSRASYPLPFLCPWRKNRERAKNYVPFSPPVDFFLFKSVSRKVKIRESGRRFPIRVGVGESTESFSLSPYPVPLLPPEKNRGKISAPSSFPLTPCAHGILGICSFLR